MLAAVDSFLNMSGSSVQLMYGSVPQRARHYTAASAHAPVQANVLLKPYTVSASLCLPLILPCNDVARLMRGMEHHLASHQSTVDAAGAS